MLNIDLTAISARRTFQITLPVLLNESDIPALRAPLGQGLWLTSADKLIWETFTEASEQAIIKRFMQLLDLDVAPQLMLIQTCQLIEH